MLPQVFLNRMESMLGNEYPAFLESYDKDKYQALRLNSIKGDTAQMKEKVPFSLQPIAWAKDGFYYEKDDTPGKHPLHEAGVYYIQEPSAMAPVSYLMEDYDVVQKEAADCQERILDLCAAPGGKSTQIAARMHEMYTSGKWKEQGLLICNEIHPARAKILSENVERMGIANAMVTNESPQRLAEVFEDYFTRILVDAPCSGEGMFRKEKKMVKAWEEHGPEFFSKIQRSIVTQAAQMLRPGGMLLYSTCTFSPEENEQTIEYLLQEYPEFKICEMEGYEGFADGMPQVTESKNPELEKTVRIFPHRMKGEGHFLALLQKGEKQEEGKRLPESGKNKKLPEELEEFLGHIDRKFDSSRMDLRGEKVYYMPEGLPTLRGIRFLRTGLLMGELKKNRFEPSQALAMNLKKEEYDQVIDLPLEDERVMKYLKGETLDVEDLVKPKDKGWYLICVDGYPLGFGKLVNQMLKNKYLPGWRWNS